MTLALMLGAALAATCCLTAQTNYSEFLNEKMGSFQTTPRYMIYRSVVTTNPRQLVKGKGDSPMLNYIFDSYATSNKHFHDKFKAPSFGEEIESEATTLDGDTGSTINFDCRVTSLRDKTVSWLKFSDEENLELLTLDLETHTTDKRYKVDLAGDIWRLSLREAKVQDSGVYCCHVSTHPPMLKRFKLIVHPPEMVISNEAFLETGETLSLKCAVVHLSCNAEEPRMRWYKDNGTSPIEENRADVLVETDQMALTSHLQIARVKIEDAGKYTCSLEAPLKMVASSRVHVLQGSSLAELQSGVKTKTGFTSLLLCSILVIMYTRCYSLR